MSPLLGAVVLSLAGWRMTFWSLAVLGLLMAISAKFVVPESLAPGNRHSGGLRAFGRATRVILTNRRFVGYVIVASSAFISLFAYVATSSFILQTMKGLSPMKYALVFAANSGAMALASIVSARLAGKVRTRHLIFVGQILGLLSGVAMLFGALWLGTPLNVVIVSFIVLMVGQGFTITNGGALASAEVPKHPGTGSAVLGLIQWTTAGLVAPIAGIGGSDTVVPLAVLMIFGAILSLFGLLVLARPDRAQSLTQDCPGFRSAKPLSYAAVNRDRRVADLFPSIGTTLQNVAKCPILSLGSIDRHRATKTRMITPREDLHAKQ